MGWVEIALIVLVLGAIVVLIYSFWRWATGSGPVATPTQVFLNNTQGEAATPQGKRVGIRLIIASSGNPLGGRNVTFTLLPGADGQLTSTLSGASAGNTSLTVGTDASGEAWVTITGTANGQDSVEIYVGAANRVAEVTYETTGP